ncbi:MAG: DUF924 domain-containing protein [Gammaproteobacteria bacterium]|nr:DUF924 domain-containing protein [Gammaproteobacteria bacterium]MBQ0839577.1 DUF924 domain-containing protein [Gammaproteobacteria bacterium]
MPYMSVIEFWFEEITPAQWWQKSPAFDALIDKRFADLHRAATRCELFAWRRRPLGRLAEIIVLDQFSRHLSRNQCQAFAHDNLALALAQQAIAAGIAKRLCTKHQGFLYMPFMHSESREIQKQSVQLFSQPGLDSHLSSAERHRAIIERFGRYPHRNKILGRTSSAAELAFLKQPGSSF